MAISTFSRFYYGYEVLLTGNKFQFDEGSGEITSVIPLGVYSPTDLATAIQQELNADGTLSYTVTFNRSSRIFSITASGAFDILAGTGTLSSNGVYDVIGYAFSDYTGASTYEGDVSGSEYVTQFPPQDYVAPGFNVEKQDASVNVSANGQVEVISFGDVEFIEMNLMYITDVLMDGKVIRNNQSGVQDALDLLNFLIKRGGIEFMPDESDVNTFYKCILESTPEDGKGVKFKLKEETGKNLPGFYTTGKLEFRILE